MQRLLLMRHSYAASGYTDEERPLTERGRTVATQTGTLLSENPPDLILASTAVRATETAELVQLELPNAPEIQLLDRLYLAPPIAYFEAAMEFESAAESILVVGHNPGMASLINSWNDSILSVSPACVAVFVVPEASWSLDATDALPRLVEYYSEGVRVV